VLIISVATGLFLPLEQEVARRKGHERVGAERDGALVLRAIRIGLVTSAAATAVALCLHGVLLRLLAGNGNLLAAFCVALPGYACCFVTRGLFAGTGETVRYGVQLAAEGLFRLLALVVFVASAPADVAYIGWLFGVAPWVALAASLIGRRPAVGSNGGGSTDRGSNGGGSTDAPVREAQSLLRPLALLVVSSFAAQLLINSGPVVVQLLATPAERSRAGAFLAILVIIRLPVVMFTAVQPIFLPSLSAHVAAGRHTAFGALLRRVLLTCATFSLVSALAIAAVGPPIMRLLFGFHDQISRLVYLATGLSVGLFLLASIMSQALLAAGSHLATTVGWLIGAAGLAAGTTIGTDPVDRATTGFLLGAVAAMSSFALMLRLKAAPEARGGLTFDVGR
jgi:O-antigen/teichoic acid export membrane protein